MTACTHNCCHANFLVATGVPSSAVEVGNNVAVAIIHVNSAQVSANAVKLL